MADPTSIHFRGPKLSQQPIYPMEIEANGSFEDFPTEILELIFFYADEKSLAALACTSRRLRDVVCKVQDRNFKEKFGFVLPIILVQLKLKPKILRILEEPAVVKQLSKGELFGCLSTLSTPTSVSLYHLDNNLTTRKRVEMQLARQYKVLVDRKCRMSQLAMKLFVKIGDFKLEDTKYQVVAFRPIHSKDLAAKVTKIAFFKFEESVQFSALGYFSTHHTFQVIHKNTEHGKYLLIGDIHYQDRADTPNGSDRVLDQKLTQVMVEYFIQQNTRNISVNYCRDDLAVLEAGGFRGSFHIEKEKTPALDHVLSFRQDHPDHKLFPTYRDYFGGVAHLLRDNLGVENVYFQKGEPTSWAKIINSNPILHPGYAALP